MGHTWEGARGGVRRACFLLHVEVSVRPVAHRRMNKIDRAQIRDTAHLAHRIGPRASGLVSRRDVEGRGRVDRANRRAYR